jgi:hypothetical protein
MDDHRANRAAGDDLRANVWLNGVVILALVAAALNHGVHAWDGGSYLAAAWAILDITCIFLLSLNIAPRRRKK